MNIRELKRSPVLDDPDPFDLIVEAAESSVTNSKLVTFPHNVATLAVLLHLETMSGQAGEEWEAAMLGPALSGEVPHYMPRSAAKVERLLSAAPTVLRAIDLASHPDVTPVNITIDQRRAAGEALLAGAYASSALGFLNQALLGWRDFKVHGHDVGLMHRSPERLRRRIDGGLHAEASHNAAFADRPIGDAETEFFVRLNSLRAGANSWDWTNADELIAGALLGARAAGRLLHRWDLDGATTIGTPGRFTINDYRNIAEVLTAIATIGDQIGDWRSTLGGSRLLRGSRAAWLDVLARHSGLTTEQVDPVLAYVTRDRRDEPRGQRGGRQATITPLFDIGGEELALSVTCAMWWDPAWSLYSTWIRRDHGDFGAKTKARGHELAREVRDIFQARG